MKCPHGDHELQVPDTVLLSVSTYGGNARAATLCCGHGVYVAREISYRIKPMLSGIEDDWGNAILPLVKA